MKCSAILLAAGLGTRMKSRTIKVLHPLAGRPILTYSLETANHLNPEGLYVVIGHQAERVKETFSGSDIEPHWIIQSEQLGTAHAVRCAMPSLSEATETVVVLYGDVPLLRAETLQDLLDQHRETQAYITLLTAVLEAPTGYGRILRDGTGRICRIVEEADTDRKQKEIQEINTGIYCFRYSLLAEAIDTLEADNAQGEYYLTDIFAYAADKGYLVHSKVTDEPFRALGINSRKDLAEAEAVLRKEICEKWMREGVTIVDPGHTYIEPSVSLGKDTCIEPNCHLTGQTTVGSDCLIETGSVIRDSILGNNVNVRPYSVIQGSRAGEGVTIGPMAHLRPGTVLGDDVRVGNFVEIKEARLDIGTKAAHLSYLGDCEVGKQVNIGCGTITCNYDGSEKHQTIIDDQAFIGSDTQLIAPVKVGKGAYIGSGSTVTMDVPADALAISRARQKTIEGWAKKMKSLKSKK